MPLTETEIKTHPPRLRRPSLHRRPRRSVSSHSPDWASNLDLAQEKERARELCQPRGAWPDLSLKDARAALAKRSGRQVPPSAVRVGDVLDDQTKPRYRVTKNVRVYVNQAKAEFGGRRLQELSRTGVARFARSYSKTAPLAANRCLSTLKLALGRAVEVGLLDHNSAQRLTRRAASGEEQSRRRTLSDREIRQLWRLDSPNTNLLRGLLLTACRISELQRACLDNVRGDWLIIPDEHSKNKRAHRVYILPRGAHNSTACHPHSFAR